MLLLQLEYKNIDIDKYFEIQKRVYCIDIDM